MEDGVNEVKGSCANASSSADGVSRAKQMPVTKERLGVKTLSPVESDSYKNQVLAIKEGLEQGAMNIGVTAPYGGGKSSLVKTLLKDKKLKKRTITVSFSDLNAANNSSDREQIEKSLLQQILFSLDPKNIGGSRVYRAHDEPKWRQALFAVAIVFFGLSVAASALSISGDAISKFFRDLDCQQVGDFVANFRLAFLFIGLILATISLCVLAFYVKAMVVKVKNIDLEVQRDKTRVAQKDDSLLSKYFDELVYYFRKSKKNILVLEDIDRCDTWRQSVFSDLRQLNISLNGCSDICKTGRLTFIYCLDDKIFEKEKEMQKFFDLIVPVTPVVNYGNAENKLSEAFGEVDELKRYILDDKEDKLFLPLLSKFVDDMRIIRSSINEYLITYLHEGTIEPNKTNGDGVKSNLLLCFYHNLYPSKYEELFTENSEYKTARKLSATNREAYCAKLRSDLEDLTTKTKILSPIVIPAKYRLMIDGFLQRKQGGTSGPVGKEINNIETLSDKSQVIYVRKDQRAYSIPMYVSDNLRNIEHATGVDFYKEIEEPLKRAAAAATSEYQKLSEELQNVPKNPISFAKKYPSRAFNEPLEKSEDVSMSFMRAMITHGYFDDSLLDRLVSQTDRNVRGTTAFVLRAFIDKKPDITTMDIFSPADVCRRAEAYYFKDAFPINADIIEALLSDVDFREKRDTLFDVIRNGGEEIQKKKRQLVSCDLDVHRKTIEWLLEDKDYLRSCLEEDGIDEKVLIDRKEAIRKIILKANRGSVKGQNDLPKVIFTIWKSEMIIPREAELLAGLEADFEASGLSYPDVSYAKGDMATWRFVLSSNIWEVNDTNLSLLIDENERKSGYDAFVSNIENGRYKIFEGLDYQRLLSRIKENEMRVRKFFIFADPTSEASKESARKMADYYEATGEIGNISLEDFESCLEETGVRKELDEKESKIREEIFDENK